jgi:beta-1,4-mannosyltransferase
MFGCGLPVAAKGFPALPELVKDGINGMIFNTPDELASQVSMLQNFFPRL